MWFFNILLANPIKLFIQPDPGVSLNGLAQGLDRWYMSTSARELMVVRNVIY